MPAAFDAIIVGAGPAGSAVARRLALRGGRVALLERSSFQVPRVGESLAPIVHQLVRELGLGQAFLALSSLPSWGTRSAWGEGEQRSHSHMLGPYGCGWHVDRRAFDRMLAHGAAAAGACLHEGTSARAFDPADGRWTVRVAAGKREFSMTSRVLVDATGRRAKVARALGARPIQFDRLVGVATRWAGVDPDERGHLLVEAACDGWWYSAPLPRGEGDGAADMIAMLMTDADLCSTLRLGAAPHWDASLRSAGATLERLRPARRVSDPEVHCALSQRLGRVNAREGAPWLAVGDAALSVDPVSGSGVARALRTGSAAAETLCEVLERPHGAREAVEAYEADRDRECTAFLLERARYYAGEERFDTPFWRRRRVLDRAAPGR